VALQAARERQRLTAVLDSTYRNFAAFAARKVEVGESPPLEQLSAKAEWERVKLERQAAEADALAAEAVLRQWTGTAIGPLAPLAELPAPRLDSAQALSGPELGVLAGEASVRAAEAQLAQAQWMPSLKFGAFNQSLDGETPFWGGLVGLSIPLVKTGQGGTVKAARIDAVMAENEKLAGERQARAQHAAAVQEYRKRMQENVYYADEGLALAVALERNATGNYTAGQVGHTEYIQALRQASELRNGRINALLALDRSIIELNYLNGQ
jgi:outer membrane protein TolC